MLFLVEKYAKPFLMVIIKEEYFAVGRASLWGYSDASSKISRIIAIVSLMFCSVRVG